jgi:hypothetical protein
MPPAGFEPAIPASERLRTHAVDCADGGIGLTHIYILITAIVVVVTFKEGHRLRVASQNLHSRRFPGIQTSGGGGGFFLFAGNSTYTERFVRAPFADYVRADKLNLCPSVLCSVP